MLITTELLHKDPYKINTIHNDSLYHAAHDIIGSYWHGFYLMLYNKWIHIEPMTVVEEM